MLSVVLEHWLSTANILIESVMLDDAKLFHLHGLFHLTSGL
jgi:hypothetical protein